MIFLPSTNAALPVKRLTSVGADFIEWGAGGKTAHWALGDSYWTYDVATGVSTERRGVSVRMLLAMCRAVRSRFAVQR
ncbi:MAG: hypothetical protein U0163_19985 [Gemmatimonadaceae bacterium]